MKTYLNQAFPTNYFYILQIPYQQFVDRSTPGTSSVAIVQDINRLKRTELSSAQNAIIAIQSQIKTKYLESYDEAMQAIRDRIEENLIAATGVNKQIFKKTSAMIAISKIDNDLDIICREVTRKAYDIGEVFR